MNEDDMWMSILLAEADSAFFLEGDASLFGSTTTVNCQGPDLTVLSSRLSIRREERYDRLLIWISLTSRSGRCSKLQSHLVSSNRQGYNKPDAHYESCSKTFLDLGRCSEDRYLLRYLFTCPWRKAFRNISRFAGPLNPDV